MPDLVLFCARPHIKNIDLRTARFVVGTVRGLDVDGRHLERGELLPAGALSDAALREEYDTPVRRLETIEHAFTDEALRTECLRHGVALEPASPPAPEEEQRYVSAEDLDKMSITELMRLCKEAGLPHIGNAKQLRKRLISRMED